MLGSYSMNFILLYMICGFTSAFFCFYILRWYFIGHTIGALAVGVIGSFAGALIGSIFFHEGISVINASIAFIISFLSLYLFHSVSKHYPD